MHDLKDENIQTLFSTKFQKISRWTVILVLWIMIASVATGKAGIANFMALIKERDILKKAVLELEVQNQTIEENMQLLKTSRLTQERFLKQNYAYAEQNEYVFQFKKELSSQ